MSDLIPSQARPGPLVSIVTPTYNQSRFIEETIQSVLNQYYPNLEYIIVDGGSQDGSVEIIQKYAHRLAWWVSEPDKGQTDAINKGFTRAKGDILAWINSDDTYLPGAVSEAVAYLIAHPETGMVYGDANLIDASGNILGPFPARQTDYYRLRQGYVHIPQESRFFRASLWKQVGMAFSTKDVLDAMARDAGLRLAALRVGGGAAANDFLMQFQADVLGVPVTRPDMLESTALGAAGLAGIATGVWRRPEAFLAGRRFTRFAPARRAAAAAARLAEWQRAVAAALHWAGRRTSRRAR